MKTIYKILIAFLAITMVASSVSAFDQIGNQPRLYTDTGIDYHDTITSAHGRLPTMGEIEEITSTQNQPTQNDGFVGYEIFFY